MGYDLISGEGTYFGYELSYSDVFRQSCLADKVVLRDEDDEQSEVGSEDEDEETWEERLVKRNPHIRLRNAWDLFIEQKHPELKAFNIKTFIGCKKIAAEHETRSYTRDCSVVFGYSLQNFQPIGSSATKAIKCHFPGDFTFPDNMAELLKEFGGETNFGDSAWKVSSVPKVVMFLHHL